MNQPPQTHLNLSGCGLWGPQKEAWEWLVRVGVSNYTRGASDKRVPASREQSLGTSMGGVVKGVENWDKYPILALGLKIMGSGYFVPWYVLDHRDHSATTLF